MIEQRLDHHWLDKQQKHENWQRRYPKTQPPAPRAPPDDGVEDPHEHDSNHEFDDLALGPVPKPRAPSLHRLFVVEVETMLEQVQRRARQVEGEQERGYEDGGLNESPVSGGFGAKPELRSKAVS